MQNLLSSQVKDIIKAERRNHMEWKMEAYYRAPSLIGTITLK